MKRLLLIRHAEAEDRVDFKKTKKPDSLRPLTSKGEREFKSYSKAIRTLLPEVDLLVTSPYIRAKQTATILAKNYPRARLVERREAMPLQAPARILKWLSAQTRRSASVCVIGHEPMLGKLIEAATRDTGIGRISLKKGGACLLKFKNVDEKKGELEFQTAEVQCFIQPSQLKKLAAVLDSDS